MDDVKKMIIEKIQQCERPDLVYLIYRIIKNLPF